MSSKVEKSLTDSERLEKIIELLEKIDWKLWEIYQKSQQPTDKVIKK